MKKSRNNFFKIVTQNDEITQIVQTTKHEIILPNEFKFKTLNISHLNEIHHLLKNHYIEDDQHILRLIYGYDFLYWYLQYIPSGLIVGLVYRKKLVGLVTAILFDMVICGHKLKVPYLNLFCLQKKIRSIGLGQTMINELENRINSMGIHYGLFTSMQNTESFLPFSMTNDFVIPINYSLLKEVGFLDETQFDTETINGTNPFHLMTKEDISIVVPKLNKYLEKYDIKIYFNLESGEYLLFPKKNIVYSFVVKKDNNITDFVSVYQNYYYCIEQNKIITVANLAFYFNEMPLTKLIVFLINKLKNYGFDQLVFRNFADNQTINYTKFLTHGQLNYFFYNIAIKKIEPSKIFIFPF